MSSVITRRRLFLVAELVLVLLLFSASVGLHWAELDRPLSGGHEWITAQTAIVHDIWYRDGGPAASHFAMRMQYPRAVDKHINNASMGNHYPSYPHDGAGNYYYLSHATLGIVAPYAAMRALNQPPSVLGVQLFNLAIHLLCALLLYACVRMAMPRERGPHLPAVLAAGVYLGVPVALWFHANVYFVEIFVQLPFIATVAAVLWYLRRRAWEHDGEYDAGPWGAALIALLVAAACLSEWMGYTLAAAVFVVGITGVAGGRDLRLAAAAVLGAVLGGTVFFVQHALIVGPGAFANHLLQQFLYRSWADDSAMEQNDACIPEVDLANIASYYLDGYRPLVPVLALLLVLAVIGLWRSSRRAGIEAVPWRWMTTLLVLVALPPLLHHLLLPGFTAQHSYAVLKSGFALAVLAAVLAWCAMRWRPGAIAATVGLALLAVVVAPQAVQGYREFAGVTAGGIGVYRATIAAIDAHADDGEVVFLLTPCLVRPQVLYHTGRNIQPVHSEEEARQWLRDSPAGATRGIVFQRGRDRYTRITIDAE